ncbi:MFS transporter, DHA2 family, multidrug resistance protein [Sphingomonas laterariae]|uniref:MFS transporter, DHA2 family, multidrug resistance protein n=1 Tax=Edaphosphingomonas laterariae TaxID=861865 RepID=A0A239CVD4_9SPHN|nr:DHA2 family efflux MFS transporter permease subunit [Sphingomonas laterariae]SNS23758.1 MFS transporter, DHA2 family, multidrug resistance protein [Sphingomonas laterariae]
MEAHASAPQALPSPAKRLAITITVMAATLMQVLDSTIANVALPHMQASLGATQESIAWVLTSYIIAVAIATPVTGWLESRFGRRELFTASVIGFTVASAACGLAPTLETMVAARILQGVFGAFIGPLTQAAMLDSYPKEKHAQALTIWGMGVMIAPIMGPVLGGWLTDQWNWRWVFFINVPFGIVTAIACWVLLSSARLQKTALDITGFILISMMLVGFQLMLDRGTHLDWFESTEIIIECAIFVIGLWMYIVHSATTAHPLIPLGLFRDRNFMVANLFMFLASGVSIAGSALMAPMLQTLLGYDAYGAGLLVAPRGAAMMLSMLLAGILAKHVDGRIMIGFGLALIAISQMMMAGFDLDMGSGPIIWSGVIQGLGTGFVVLSLNLLAFATLAPHLRTEGAALYSLSRNIGSSVAISVLSALLARNVQVSHSDLSAHVTASSLPFVTPAVIEKLGAQGADLLRLIDSEVNRQALMIAYIDDYWLMGWAVVVLLPFVLLMRSAKPQPGAEPPPMME